MTTYTYTLTLNDSEMIALTRALDLYETKCRYEVAMGNQAPFPAYLAAVASIRDRLDGIEAKLTSTILSE